MSSHQDDHHVSEQKPVAFTVPLILAAVLVLIMVLFLSLCDPKPHNSHEVDHNDQTGQVEATHHGATEHDGHEHAAGDSQTKTDSASVETDMPVTEAAHGAETTH